jgi:hypothetical protein
MDIYSELLPSQTKPVKPQGWRFTLGSDGLEVVPLVTPVCSYSEIPIRMHHTCRETCHPSTPQVLGLPHADYMPERVHVRYRTDSLIN